MAAAPTRTPEGDASFFMSLVIGDTVAQACLASGYARSSVYEWRRTDRAFAEAWNDAVYAALSAEADRRLRERYEQPVCRDGIVTGYRRKCPDELLFERYSALRDERSWREPAPAAPPAKPPSPPVPMPITVRPNLFARWRERLTWLWPARAKAHPHAR